TYREALDIVLKHAYPLEKEKVSFSDSMGRILAEDVFSDINMPPFNRSAVDGFACRREDLGSMLEVIETIRAGLFPERIIGQGQCTRIMTGAPVPEGADCVIMVEDAVEMTPGSIRFTGGKTKANISPFAEDVKAGDRVIPAGTQVGPQHIAIMAAVGHVHPVVTVRPKVAVISTGDEIVEPHVKPGISQIRNSNGYQLTAQAVKAGADAAYLGIAPDQEDDTYRAVTDAMDRSDVVLLTGGVSMGTYDFVPKIFEKAGMDILFRTISVQPGKPTIFGIKGRKRIFGLPGNPVSSFTIFEILVKPMLQKMLGAGQSRDLRLPLGSDYERKRSDRMQWLPVEIRDGQVHLLEYHGSAHIFSLAKADAIAAIPLGITKLSAGDLVDVRPI
ncbi:MAG: molybdopterin molybdotransferase MoeA, partial [Bacteroidales bacterium]|nr:molybdopterin molybdotransferase MoeA [Bacteroidales bacterium]